MSMTFNPADHGELTLDIEHRGVDECPRIEFNDKRLGGPHPLISWEQFVEATVYEICNIAALSPDEAVAAARRGADRVQAAIDRIDAGNAAS